jgi:signal transduction histidine kinase
MALVPVEARSVFPTDLLLDHIPGLIEEIGKYVAQPAEEDIAARTLVIAKARALGQLRHQQQASLHQVLREYDLLGEVLEEFLVDEVTALPLASLADCLEASRRIGRAVRVLMQMTAGTFISEYTQTVSEQTERLDRFNRAIGHELRNVLGTLQVAATLLGAESATDEAQRRRISATVQRSSDRAIKIIRSLERLPRSGIVGDKPTEQTVDLSELINEVFRQLQDMADARGVELRTSSEPCRAYLDTGALELVLVNLVANAIKYSDPQKPVRFVDVDCRVHDEHYHIGVEDNGIGIPDGSKASVFERYARAHSDLDGDLGVDGTGLGLAIVQECVKALGGDIGLESGEHRGTTFTVRIPKKVPPIPVVPTEPPVSER